MKKSGSQTDGAVTILFVKSTTIEIEYSHCHISAIYPII